MKSLLGKGLVLGAALAAAGVLVPQSGHATTAPRTFGDCMEIAVDNDADPWIAHDACGSESLTGCYRIFYAEYGRQQWALEACQARDDE